MQHYSFVWSCHVGLSGASVASLLYRQKMFKMLINTLNLTVPARITTI